MSVIGQIAFFSALAIIVVIGIDLFVRQPGQRGDRRGVREPLPEGAGAVGRGADRGRAHHLRRGVAHIVTD
jgi:hypothetical protein